MSSHHPTASTPPSPAYSDAAEGQIRRPEYRHGTVLGQSWFEVALQPSQWLAGGWALFGAVLTTFATATALLYLSNLLGVDVAFETEAWLVVAGLLGFASITAALWAIWKNQRRRTAIVALLLSLAAGAIPAWLLGNTILQFLLGGGAPAAAQ